jgi:hypothetical protein
MYAIEFMFLSVVKVMVLDRMKDFAVPSTDKQLHRWVVASRVVWVAVFAGNIIGVCANIAAASYWKDCASYATQAFDAPKDGNVTSWINSGKDLVKKADVAQSVQEFCEVADCACMLRVMHVTPSPQVAVLLLVIASFSVVGFLSVRRITSGRTPLPCPP